MINPSQNTSDAGTPDFAKFRGSVPKVIPVIHHLDAATSMAEAEAAFSCNADGVFLISHHGQCMDLLELARVIKARAPSKMVGVNLLSKSCETAYEMAVEFELDAVWADRVGVSSIGVTDAGWKLAERIKSSRHKPLVFGGVAFKYQPVDPYPAVAARMAADLGMVPTTSGVATGAPPTVEKITAMSTATSGVLAIASGMTCENVGDYASLLAYILVSTGVSRDEYHLDPQKLSAFIEVVRRRCALLGVQMESIEKMSQLRGQGSCVITHPSGLGKSSLTNKQG